MEIIVQKGDRVALSTGYGKVRYTVYTVQGITPSGRIILDNGRQYYPSGLPVGKSNNKWSSECIVALTPEIEAAIRREFHVALLRNMDWNTLDDATLEQIVTLVKKPAEKEIQK